jgi:uncharacterized protein YxeA
MQHLVRITEIMDIMVVMIIGRVMIISQQLSTGSEPMYTQISNNKKAAQQCSEHSDATLYHYDNMGITSRIQLTSHGV